jgi:hypothetical protein
MNLLRISKILYLMRHSALVSQLKKVEAIQQRKKRYYNFTI